MEYRVVTKTFKHPLNLNDSREQFTDDFNGSFDDSYEILERKVNTYREGSYIMLVVTFLLHKK